MQHRGNFYSNFGCFSFFYKDSGDKMSSDSLCLTPPEEDSCEEEAQIHGLSPRDYDSFRPAEKNMEKDLQTEDTEQRPQTQMVTHFFNLQHC